MERSPIFRYCTRTAACTSINNHIKAKICVSNKNKKQILCYKKNLEDFLKTKYRFFKIFEILLVVQSLRLSCSGGSVDKDVKDESNLNKRVLRSNVNKQETEKKSKKKLSITPLLKAKKENELVVREDTHTLVVSTPPPPRA